MPNMVNIRALLGLTGHSLGLRTLLSLIWMGLIRPSLALIWGLLHTTGLFMALFWPCWAFFGPYWALLQALLGLTEPYIGIIENQVQGRGFYRKTGYFGPVIIFATLQQCIVMTIVMVCNLKSFINNAETHSKHFLGHSYTIEKICIDYKIYKQVEFGENY